MRLGAGPWAALAVAFMDGLKALLAKKRKAADEETNGRGSVKRADIEQARIQQLRSEERQELDAKVDYDAVESMCLHSHW